MKPVKTWILIADGAHGRLFENRGPGTGLEAINEEFEADHRPDHEIVTDHLGRTFESAYSARHAIAPRHDPHRELKRDFAKSLAKLLDRRRQEHAFDRLIIVAPPKVLGDLRNALSESVRELVSAELDKDLTKTPVGDLPGHLVGMLAV
jgi:protein required for attachment to host cells